MFNIASPAQNIVFADAARLSSIRLNLQKHVGNTEIHVTKEDKERWNSAATEQSVNELRADLEQQIEELRSIVDMYIQYIKCPNQ